MNKVKDLAKKGVASATVAALTVASLPYKTFASDPQGKARAGFDSVKTEVGANDDLYGSVGMILNVVYGVIGIVAVVMIILGGVNYATSQGDPGKVKKGKDTILYGVIGLVIVLIAFPITAFILDGLAG